LHTIDYLFISVRLSHLVRVGERSFADSASPELWNSLPDDVTSASSSTVFRQKLKMHFISAVMSGHIACLVVLTVVVLAVIVLRPP